MTHADPARILMRASAAIRRRDVIWGREWFLNPADCTRCALGAIAWAAGDELDGNPFFIDGGSHAAVAFARWLVDTGRGTECTTDDRFDPLETVAGYNDAPAMDADRMWRALSDCAADLDERAASKQRHPAGKALAK